MNLNQQLVPCCLRWPASEQKLILKNKVSELKLKKQELKQSVKEYSSIAFNGQSLEVSETVLINLSEAEFELASTESQITSFKFDINSFSSAAIIRRKKLRRRQRGGYKG